LVPLASQRTEDWNSSFKNTEMQEEPFI